MSTKTSQLQIRISPSQKEMLKRMADQAGLSLSAYVLSRALPSVRRELETKIEALRVQDGGESALRELLTYLSGLPDEAYREAVDAPVPADLPPVQKNLVTAAVEWEAVRRSMSPPAWAATVEPLSEPHFSRDLPALRPHLLRVAPAAFKRRRLFVADPTDSRS